MSEEQLILLSQLDDCVVVFSDNIIYIVTDGEPVEAEFNAN